MGNATTHVTLDNHTHDHAEVSVTVRESHSKSETYRVSIEPGRVAFLQVHRGSIGMSVCMYASLARVW
jgi:hypothetical protein